MKKSFLFTIFLCFPLFVAAQSLRQQVTERIVKKSEQPQSNIPSNSASVVAKTDPDTVYCLSTKKQHGWFMPMDVVSLKYAKKHGGYIMFTRKNSVGHWTKLETFDAYGNRKSGGWKPYILSNDDPQGDRNWIEKVKTGCICEMISDPQGESVVQERVYDKDMNLVFSFSHSPIGKRKYIGSYKDVYGLPAEMRKDSTFTYGTLVVITEDIWGNDSLIEYVDAKGTPKNNSNGVGMQFYVYDKYGRFIRQGSANHEGIPVLDNWGNCGGEYKYNDKRNIYSEYICMDNNWNPMPMPNLRKEAGDHAGVIKVKRKYDEFERCIEEKYVTIENKPDTNIYGVHRSIYEYNDFGDCIYYANYGIDGNLAANQWGIAKVVIKYDSLGREIDKYFYSKDGKLESRPGYRYREQTIYGEPEFKELIYYGFNEGKTDTIYHYLQNKERKFVKYTDNVIEIDSLDKNGEVYYTAYYNYDIKPIFLQNEGFHKKRINLNEMDKKSIEETILYDANSKIISRTRSEVDSVLHETLYSRFNNKGQIIESSREIWHNTPYIYDGKMAINPFGIPCRSGGDGVATYYKIDYLRNQQGKFVCYVGKDQFDEPDYYMLDFGDNYLGYYYRRQTAKGLWDYDEDNYLIINKDLFFKSHSWAMSVEVRDSLAYRLGLKDNDIILKYGDYQIDDGDSLYAYTFRAHWEAENILAADKEKDVLVLRADVNTKTCSIVELKLPGGVPSQLGFVPHLMMLTRKQNDRLTKALGEYTRTHSWTTRHNLGNKSVLVSFYEPNQFLSLKPYAQQVGVPTIILAEFLPETGRKWYHGLPFEQYSGTVVERTKSDGGAYVLHQIMTKNGKDFTEYKFEDPRLYARLATTPVSDEQYEVISKLSKKAIKQVEKELKTYEKDTKTKK